MGPESGAPSVGGLAASGEAAGEGGGTLSHRLGPAPGSRFGDVTWARIVPGGIARIERRRIVSRWARTVRGWVDCVASGSHYASRVRPPWARPAPGSSRSSSGSRPIPVSAGSARSPHNPRGCTSGRRSRRLPSDLADPGGIPRSWAPAGAPPGGSWPRTRPPPRPPSAPWLRGCHGTCATRRAGGPTSKRLPAGAFTVPGSVVVRRRMAR